MHMGKSRGRPRKYNPQPIERSDSEILIADTAMQIAKEQGISFENAFAQMLQGARPTQNVGNASKKLSLGQAARTAKMSKSTLQRMLTSGRMDGHQRAEDGIWEIDTVEVQRVIDARDAPQRGRKVAQNEDKAGPCSETVALYERLVDAEKARADAAERRCDQLLTLLEVQRHAS